MTRSTRYIALILILLSALVRPAFAEVWLGLQAGGQNARLSGSLPDGAKFASRSATLFGAVVDIPVAPDVRISLQPMYAPRGAVIAVDVPGKDESKDSIEVALDYFSVPVLARVVAGNDLVYIIGGFEVGFLVNAEWRPEGQPAVDISDSLRSVVLAADFGVGIMPRLGGSVRGILEVRYSQSLLNITRSDLSLDVPRMKYTGWQFWLGAMISMGKK